MPAIYHEGSWLGNATDPEVLVKDTVGWTGKNRAYSQTNNAVIAHIENGITYDVSWTGSATVALKKNSASGATITSGSTSPLSFTADADYELYFGSSATVTNIMVKDSRITDPTYEPYHESVEEEIEQVYADNGVLGAKNLCPFNPATGTFGGITVAKDDSTQTITMNIPSATENNRWITISDPSNNLRSGGLLLPKGSYKLSVKATGDTLTNTFKLGLSDTTGYLIASVGGPEPSSFTLDADTPLCLGIRVPQGKTLSNFTLSEIMIKLASDPDDTYQPYAMTNRELTDFVTPTVLSGVDLNNITTPGWYSLNGSITNNAGFNTGYLLVQKHFTGAIKQIAIPQGELNGAERVYIRSKQFSNFTSWYMFAGTVVS